MEYLHSFVLFFAIIYTIQANTVDEYLEKKCSEYYDGVKVETDYPHMVQLAYESKGKIVYSCIGSLISENLVLTSALCTKSPLGSPKYVRLGTDNFNKNPSQVKQYDIASEVVHPDYVKDSRNDIAILVLNKKVDFNERTRPICLQTIVDESKSTLIGTGWGKPSRGSPTSEDLKIVELERFPNVECTEKYDKFKQLNFTTEFCAVAKVEGKDICTGDGGGPIQIKHPKHEKAHLQVGITWYGPTTCGKRDFPSVYVYVPQYVSWIKEVIESNKK